VQGVGAKVALGILSTLAPDELFRAIASADKTSLNRCDGVGPKLAVRLITELKDKVGGIALSPPSPRLPCCEASAASRRRWTSLARAQPMRWCGALRKAAK
jgi:Holliday junction DNA helicase RuvA